MELFRYSNAVSDWNYIFINCKQDDIIAGFGFNNGQYYFDFGF